MKLLSLDDYRDCVSHLLQTHWGRGSKVKLAELLKCGPGYISQVLNKSKIHFSPENLIKIANHFSLPPEEEEYLLTLLGLARAGTSELRQFYQSKAQRIKEAHLKVEKQIKDITQELKDGDKAIYYSHWAYCAAHKLVSIEGFQEPLAIAQKLRTTPEFTQKVLSFLEQKELIVKGRKGEFKIGKTRIHLKADSPLVKNHHQNFCQKAMLALEQENDFNLHYSGALTLGKKDALKVRELVLKLIADNEKILGPSPNEEMISLNIDLFRF